MTHFNGLLPSEAERLALLLEELGEAQQVIGKILRHGYESHHPNGGPSNRELLERELGDVNAAIHMMTDKTDLNAKRIEYWREVKLNNVQKYLHHQDTIP